MPTFKTKDEGKTVWLPLSSIILMEEAPGRLTTIVHATLLTPKGPGIGTIEVEGRCSVLAAAIDRGEPTEIGQ